MQTAPYESITSRENEKVKEAVRIARGATARRESGLFFAEGVRLCLDLAATLRPARVFFTEKVLEQSPEVAALGVENYQIMPHVAEKLSETKSPQGLFCLFPLAGVPTAPDTGRGVLVCEDMQDPANVGAVVRSAAAFGFGGIVLAGRCADPYAPRVLRASVGAVARLPVVQTADIVEAAGLLKGQGVELWAAALENAVELDGAAPKRPFALLIGNEGKGLSAEALALSDRAVCIPMQGGVESLNAAVAASVLMYTLGRRADG